jgi:prepilin-type N-terminal cleavage/methylation domain-containing protein
VHLTRCRPAAGAGARARGFTLIELLVVAAILIVLAGIGLAQYRTLAAKLSEM